MANELRTFVLAKGGNTVSPLLVTVRDYAAWMEGYYDPFTCQLHLYLINKNNVAEWHPGTQIGKYFSSLVTNNPELKSWYIHKDSEAMEKLIRHNLATIKDCRGSKLRVFTVSQIEQYIKANIDPVFKLSNMLMNPQQISIKDMNGIESPNFKTKKKLF